MKIIRFTVAKQLLCALTFAALTNVYGADPVAVAVPGTSDPWLAGMPNGSLASCGVGFPPCDEAPAQSPVQVAGLTLTPGMALSITATELVGQAPDPIYLAGPDGTSDPAHNHDAGAENGISDITARFSSLVGVFLTAAQPDGTAAPLPAADPSHPDLKQVLLIGSSAIVTVPAGATVSDSAPGQVQDSGQANPDSDFRFEGGAGRYIFNLSTKA